VRYSWRRRCLRRDLHEAQPWRSVITQATATAARGAGTTGSIAVTVIDPRIQRWTKEKQQQKQMRQQGE
jgi:hypothetical protein